MLYTIYIWYIAIKYVQIRPLILQYSYNPLLFIRMRASEISQVNKTYLTAEDNNNCSKFFIGDVAELIGLPWAPCWAGWPWARSACRGTRRRCTWWRDTLCATATSWSTTGSGRCRPNRPPGAPGELYRRSRDTVSCAGSETRVHKICPQTIKPFKHESHFFNSCSSDR